jgi:hypothetical protein
MGTTGSAGARDFEAYFPFLIQLANSTIRLTRRNFTAKMNAKRHSKSSQNGRPRIFNQSWRYYGADPYKASDNHRL